MSSCCNIPDIDAPTKGNCDDHNDHDHSHDHSNKFDWILYGSLTVIIGSILLSLLFPDLSHFGQFSHAVLGLLKQMWWGVLLGIFAVGMMQFIPREYFRIALGAGDSVSGIFRAALAGLLLDMCSHGILMVGAKLYERGASTAQIMTFLIASPWNSLSLTFILIALIGWQWTLTFIICSAIIAIITGILFLGLTKRSIVAKNPHTVEMKDDFDFKADFKERIKHFKFSKNNINLFFTGGLKESQMVIRWLLFGTIIASLIQAFVPTDMLQTYFGASLLGLMFTLLATTIIEVCSEGSAPIGAELVNRAAAPGNGFTFLMAGVATDYTEIMVIRGFTKSWKTTMMLPLLTVPQILIFGYVMNMASF